jgi:hypothetical protein
MRTALSLVAGCAFLVFGCAGESSGKVRNTGTAGNRRAPGAPDPRELPRTYVVFADVTRSLSEQEHASVYDTVQKVVALLPPKATLIIFPILEDVQRAPSVFEGTLPAVQSTSDSVDLSVAKTRWKSLVAEKLKAIDAGPATGRNRTCISGALRKAEEVTVDASESRPVEIIIVSDMLEDCADSLLGRKLSLEKTSIDAEVKVARALPPEALLRLNGASVTVLLPTVPTSAATTKRPAVHQLEEFWRAVLDRSGDRKENFRFGTEIPQRLKDLQVQEGGGL